MADLELELTYLANGIPKAISSQKPVRIIDIYVPNDLNIHAHLRIRSSENDFSLTKKIQLDAGDASKHHEYKVPLTKEEFDELSKVSDRRVVKKRYELNINGYPAEVDVFEESLKGLVLIDFEFKTISQMDKFQAPSECLADVTQEEFIAGGYLAGRSYGDIEQDLNRFGYKKYE